jgi:hypothetical protein
MKDKRVSRFSLSEEENDYLNYEENKIELVACPRGGHNCSEHRLIINKYLLASSNYHANKDYNRSIEALKIAYSKTTDLQEPTCLNCALMFRCLVTQSLESIHDDLQKMASGFLFRKRFKSSYQLAKVVLEEFKIAR